MSLSTGRTLLYLVLVQYRNLLYCFQLCSYSDTSTHILLSYEGYLLCYLTRLRCMHSLLAPITTLDRHVQVSITPTMHHLTHKFLQCVHKLTSWLDRSKECCGSRIWIVDTRLSLPPTTAPKNNSTIVTQIVLLIYCVNSPCLGHT